MPEIERMGNNNNNEKLLFSKYEIGKLLGCGAFAKVYHARESKSNQSVAIKVINKKRLLSSNANLAANVKREVSIMRRLRHPNIVRLHEVAATRGRVYFVMDFVKGGELFARVAKGRFSEELARRYFRQLISAVGYCHSRGIFHRDLKPENLLIDDLGNLKVSDFGLSAIAADQIRSDGLLHTLCGTPAYVAPEILTKRGYEGARVDVWSCGVVLFVLIAGFLPFNDPNLIAMYNKIYKGEYRCPKWMSPELRHFLSRLLETDAEKRITVDEILRDPWFSDGGYDGADGFKGLPEKDDDDDDEIGETGERVAEELNAFDLISYSSGLDLSGLFDPAGGAAERVVMAAEMGSAAEIVEEFAIKQGMKATRKRGGAAVELEGQNGNLVIRVGFFRLSDGLVVAEAKRKAGDASAYADMWRNKLRPFLAV